MGIDFYTDVITKVFEKVVEAVLLIFFADQTISLPYQINLTQVECASFGNSFPEVQLVVTPDLTWHGIVLNENYIKLRGKYLTIDD